MNRNPNNPDFYSNPHRQQYRPPRYQRDHIRPPHSQFNYRPYPRPQRPMLRPTFKKRERDRINFPRIDPYYPSRYPSNVVNHNQQPQQTQSYQYRDVGYQTYNYRNNYPRPPGPSRDSSREQLRPVLKPAQTTFTPKVETTNKVTLLPTKKSPPPVSSSSGSEDDDLFDQDEIEEQIDRIDNEIAKQERLLALQRAKSSEVDKDPLKVAKRIPRVYNYELKIGVVEPLEKLEAKPHGNSFDPESLIETIYKENRELIKKLNTVHNRNSMNYFNLVNDGVKQFPKFDVKLFQNIEKVDPKLRPAIVSFIKSRIAATNYEQKKLGLYYKSLDEKWRVKVEVREKQLLNSQKKDVKIKEQKIVEPPKDEIFHENLLPEGRSSRRGGIRTDVVRSEAEWQNALSLLGVSSTSLASNPPAPTPPPFKATGIAKDIPLLSKYEIERLQKFTNNNDLVLDAAAELEQFNSKIQQFWTEYDRNLFRQKLAIYGKDFHKISQFLDNKSTQDCVSYYYREKISGRFKSLIKRASGRGRKRKEFEELGESVGFTTYYLQSDEEFVHGNEADDESTSERNDSETELDLLESAQSIDLPDWTPEEKQRATRGFELFGRDFESVASIVASKNAAQCKLFFNHQRRQSREPMLSGEKKKKKRARKRTDDDLVRKQTPKDEDPNASNPNTTTSTNKRSISYWTVSERQEFLKELEIHGRDWEKIATAIPSKSGIQIRNFFHNSRKKMNLDAILERRGVGEEGEADDRREEEEEEEPKGHNNRLSDLLNPEKSAELIHEPLVEVNVQEVTERYHANYNYEQMGPPNYQQYPYDYHPQIQIQYSSERPVYDPAYVPGGESYQYMYHDQQGYRQYSVYDYNDPQMEKQDSNEQLENENELLLPRPIMKVPIVQPRPTIMSPTSNNYEGPRVARIMVEPLNPSKQFSANERRESQSLPHVDEMEVDSTIDDPGRSIEEYSYMETSEQSLQDSMLPSANNSVESLDIHSNSRNLDSTVPQDSLLDTRDEDSMDVELPPILEPTESAEIAIELTEMESFHPDPADIAVDSSGQAKVMNANYQKDDTPPIIEKPREEPTVSSKNATESNDSTGIPLNQDQNPTETPKE